MGRYYDGDIQGKFWFAVQSSDDGEFFGSQECGNNYIEYYLDREIWEKEGIKGIEECKKNLQINKKLNHWDLWCEWNDYVDEYQKSNEDNSDMYFHYRNYEDWLKDEKGIGTGKPKNGERGSKEQEKYFEHEKKMRPMWEWLARLSMGMKMKEFFDDPESNEMYYTAEC